MQKDRVVVAACFAALVALAGGCASPKPQPAKVAPWNKPAREYTHQVKIPEGGSMSCQMVYPTVTPAVLASGVSGEVVASITLVDGRVEAIDMLSGPVELQELVREAVMRMRCTDAPARFVARQKFDFKIDNGPAR